MMPNQVPASGTNSIYNSSVSEQENIRPWYIVADSTSYLNLFCQEIDDRFEDVEMPALTLSVPETSGVASWDLKPEPTTPILLSPASSASSPTSTHELDLTWDSPYTPQTPLHRRCHANSNLTTPLTPPEASRGILEDRVDEAELASGTPSRKYFNNNKINFKIDVHREILGASNGRSKSLFGSITPEDAVSQDELPSRILQPPSTPKIALGNKDVHGVESRSTAVGRCSETNTSGLNATGCTNGVAKSETPVSTQPLPALRFDYSPLPTQIRAQFVATYNLSLAKDIPRSFTFGANGAAEEKYKPRVTLLQVKPEKTMEACQEIPHLCKGKWTLLEQTLPFEISVRLTDSTNACVATVITKAKRMERCSRKRVPRLNALKITVDAFRNCVSSCDYSSLLTHVERIIQDVMCPFHQTISLRGNTTSRRMDALRKLINDLPNCKERVVLLFAKWLQAIAKIDTPTSLQSVDLRTPSPLPLPRSTAYQARPTDDYKVSEALSAKARKSLTEGDRKDGFIYMFWDQRTFGMIKIGRTVDLAQRLKQWNTKCKTTHHYHRTSQDGESLQIPHVQRIEHLMHIELGNYRKKRVCDGCGQTHIEWFDISAEKAQKVYQKWQDWIIQKPYAQDAAGNWVVRPEMLGSLSQVCKPVLFSDPIKVVRPRPSLPKTRSKPRRSSASE